MTEQGTVRPVETKEADEGNRTAIVVAWDFFTAEDYEYVKNLVLNEFEEAWGEEFGRRGRA